MATRSLSSVQLVNGSIGDPLLYLDYPGSNNAILFDGGDNCKLTMKQLTDLEAVFITHHHVDHFVGLDRIIRANLDQDKKVTIYGPIHTIQRVYDRVKSYDYPFFPFMKLAIEIRELHEGMQRIGRFGCATKFASPEVVEEPWKGPICYETEFIQVETIPVMHTVPCYAFSMNEKSGWHPDPEKIKNGMLRSGIWIGEALRLLRANADSKTILEIEGGHYQLGKLAEQAFIETTGAKITYVTDTFFAEELRPALIKFARGANRLYCDSFYSKAQAKDAAKHKHMMAFQAAELAKAARVEQLILIHHATRYIGQYDLLLREADAIFPRTTHVIPTS